MKNYTKLFTFGLRHIDKYTKLSLNEYRQYLSYLHSQYLQSINCDNRNFLSFEFEKNLALDFNFLHIKFIKKIKSKKRTRKAKK